MLCDRLSALAISAVLGVVSARPVQHDSNGDKLGLDIDQVHHQIRFGAPDGISLPSTSADLIASLFETDAYANLADQDKQLMHQHVQQWPQRRLVQLSPTTAPVEVTEGHKALLTLANLRFTDVTDDPLNLAAENYALAAASFKDGKTPATGFPKKLQYSAKDLDSLFKAVSIDDMKTFLTHFTSFRTRYYKSETGKQSQQFLLSTIKSIVESNKKLNVSVSGKFFRVQTQKKFTHPWGQNSIIVRFEPDSKTVKDDKIVILGAHQDSTNLLPWFAAPGADDDGSGTTTLITSLKTLVKHSFVPSDRPVEFHFYSAEEGGLLGSQAVAQSYAHQGKQVKAMLQQDMTGYVKQGTRPTIGIIRDFVDEGLTDFVSLVVDEFAEIPRKDTKCGYACSDHASWSKIGAPSAFAIESSFEDSNKQIHSSGDTIDNPGFSFEHVKQFVRISVALAVCLGGGENVQLN
ncbi:hypothetical protein OIV83_006004 [Microbotryomycetes sp. JL201]|nr:hypothetical protein OIV83_006004 [Microbotryomycetes sp. JL201]